jgi:hypothetical protein
VENEAHYSLVGDVAETTNLNQARQLIRLHPFIKDSRNAVEIASILLMWEHDETIPMNYYKAFYQVFGPKQVDEVWRFLTCQLLRRLNDLDRIFPDKSPTRGSNIPVRIFLAVRFMREVNGKTRSKKLKAHTIVWFDNRYPKEEKFRQITTIKRLDGLFEALMSDFDEEVMKPWKHKTASFSPIEHFWVIARTNWRCQWEFPDGQECDNKLRYDQGEIDHILPRRLGGETTLRNARWICKIRNQTRGKKCKDDKTP